MTTAEQKINALFSELVPASGKADTVAGEIVRAVSRIGYRNYNDGDHIGVGYGKETCNPAARYLIKNGGNEVAVIVRGMWGMEADSLYDKAVEMLEESAAAYIEQHPDLLQMLNPACALGQLQAPDLHAQMQSAYDRVLRVRLPRASIRQRQTHVQALLGLPLGLFQRAQEQQELKRELLLEEVPRALEAYLAVIEGLYRQA